MLNVDTCRFRDSILSNVTDTGSCMMMKGDNFFLDIMCWLNETVRKFPFLRMFV